jgi:hypothetical protein
MCVPPKKNIGKCVFAVGLVIVAFNLLRVSVVEKGSNYQIAVQLMQLFSTNTCDFTKLTDILAQFFQIYEDYIHLCTKEVIG